jgi:hypothetical protein
VAYKVQGFSGPPHNREFEIEAVVDGESLGRGFGTSKKRAEQEAAAEALHALQTKARRGARRARLRGSRSRRPQAVEAGSGEAPAAGPGQAAESDRPGAACEAAPQAGPEGAASGAAGATEVG